MEGKIVVGTCGYDYPEWKGIFYPQTMNRRDFLEYYAQNFSALEINYSYYQMPTEYQFRDMIRRSGGKLLFSVKAPRTLTHQVTSDWKNEVLRFRCALLPLCNDHLLSSVLFQFPQSFHYTKENRIYLADLLNTFERTPSVVEFRNNEWLTARVCEELNRRRTGLCACDMPDLKALPSFSPVVTGNAGYIRFHGRNGGSWYKGGAGRYTYLYTEKELLEAAPRIAGMAQHAALVQIFFNNHPNGAAAVNARHMKELV